MNRIPPKIVTRGLQVTQINGDQSFKDMLNTTLETTPWITIWHHNIYDDEEEAMPSLRLCPKCNALMQADEKCIHSCKNLKCSVCNMWFCGFCLTYPLNSPSDHTTCCTECNLLKTNCKKKHKCKFMTVQKVT